MIPVFIKLKGFKVCIFGFGEVGRRRLDKIVSGEPERITVYTKEEIDEETKRHYESICNIQFITSNLEELGDREIEEIVKEHDFIITAMGEENNRRIVNIAKRCKKFINSSTFERDINFIIPAYCYRDGIYFVIYTEGRSPLMARRIRELVEKYIENHREEIELQSNLRTFLKECVPSQRDRRDILEKVFKNEEFKRELLNLIEKYGRKK
ncbi:MAG TPA: bifunctional precorrin-2 dehydrogenase/sirohydrochlorin ferrochelatase [Methanococcaceae archaeon]|uniref:precorrin-2 dehydrogenase n=1 Tax=Methanothermococcus okinawensis TaxID=155863 RepID=A0A833E3Z6_9EURY|nr:bifunctional precorrin-2 dehydrogenase/sirohydrochlorin ferrochelatase [Methanococcaceae archaeon]HIP91145.1 bifunctional precorrin-2 dehydrogenase/sirohydrochlorin ferrochelatase [Methanothermococcus okinawensis]